MIRINNLQKNFGTKKAVDIENYTIGQGDMLGLVGNNGAGKTTLFRMITGQEKPDSGTIEIDGTIQIIFQHPETSLDPAKKIGYSLEEPMIIHKMYDKAGRKKRVKELLDRVDLGEELLDRYPHQISGGEAQRIMIARALSLDPKILILDEPTSMLDVSVQAQVMTLLKELQEKLGLSYLFISHDLDVVRWFCDEIAVMEEGKFVETGRTEDVIGHPKAEFTKRLVENFILE